MVSAYDAKIFANSVGVQPRSVGKNVAQGVSLGLDDAHEYKPRSGERTRSDMHSIASDDEHQVPHAFLSPLRGSTATVPITPLLPLRG